MKIAQIAPLMESVAPRLYGGTERVVSHLCEALVQEGHDVTLFASGDSVTSARLVACTKEAIRLNAAIRDHVPHYMIMLDKLRRSSHLFDILHFHIDAFHMPLFRDIGAKTLTTLHGRQDLPDLLPLALVRTGLTRHNLPADCSNDRADECSTWTNSSKAAISISK